MSFAIIRNTKYKRENLKGIYRHNERKNKNYSNDNIDKERSYLNYSIKSHKYRYDKEFDRIKERKEEEERRKKSRSGKINSSKFCSSAQSQNAFGNSCSSFR